MRYIVRDRAGTKIGQTENSDTANVIMHRAGAGTAVTTEDGIILRFHPSTSDSDKRKHERRNYSGKAPAATEEKNPAKKVAPTTQPTPSASEQASVPETTQAPEVAPVIAATAPTDAATPVATATAASEQHVESEFDFSSSCRFDGCKGPVHVVKLETRDRDLDGYCVKHRKKKMMEKWYQANKDKHNAQDRTKKAQRGSGSEASTSKAIAPNPEKSVRWYKDEVNVSGYREQIQKASVLFGEQLADTIEQLVAQAVDNHPDVIRARKILAAIDDARS